MRPTLAELAALHSANRVPQRKRNRHLRELGYNPDGEDGRVYRELLRQEIAKSVLEETNKPADRPA